MLAVGSIGYEEATLREFISDNLRLMRLNDADNEFTAGMIRRSNGRAMVTLERQFHGVKVGGCQVVGGFDWGRLRFFRCLDPGGGISLDTNPAVTDSIAGGIALSQLVDLTKTEYDIQNIEREVRSALLCPQGARSDALVWVITARRRSGSGPSPRVSIDAMNGQVCEVTGLQTVIF